MIYTIHPQTLECPAEYGCSEPITCSVCHEEHDASQEFHTWVPHTFTGEPVCMDECRDKQDIESYREAIFDAVEKCRQELVRINRLYQIDNESAFDCADDPSELLENWMSEAWKNARAEKY